MAEIKDGKMEWESPVLVRLSGASKTVGSEVSKCEPFGSGVFLPPCIEFGLSPSRNEIH